jgi:HEAT repeat protein
MNTITALRQELHRLIALNYAEQWVDAPTALLRLRTFGNELIPSLIEFLEDTDAEVRVLVIELLDAAGSRSEPAIPILIRKLSDPDRLVRIAAASSLRKFGPKAGSAVPHLESWLADDHEYVRIIAATTILWVDPTKYLSLMPVVMAARRSENIMVRGQADDFLRGYG